MFLFDARGEMFSIPAGWTDADPPDPYVAISAGRSAFRLADLVELAALLDRLRPPDRPLPVKPTMP